MWILEHKFKLILCRNLQTLVSTSRVGFQAASYRRTACLLSPEDEYEDGNERVGRSPNFQQKPEGFRGSRRSSQSKLSNIKTSSLPDQRGDPFRLSSELQKLSQDDLPVDRKRPMAEVYTEAKTHEVIFGVAPCLLALSRGRRKAYELLVKNGETSERPSVARVCEEALRRGVPIKYVEKKDLNMASNNGVHQGLCLRVSPLRFLTLDSEPEEDGVPLWLVLEQLQDPMNFGAILRSAYFLGVDGVISSIRHSCPLSPTVSKASSGVMEVMRVYGHNNLEHLLKQRVARGWQVVGTVGAGTAESNIPIVQCSDYCLSGPTLLLMGSEGNGLSQRLLSLCQELLTVSPGRDLFPGIESLNVSVAAGIVLHSLLHKRKELSQM